MGETSAIEWTDATWNPWRGCRKVSPGCKHCYMFRDQERYGRDPRMVFTCSWSDWFIEEADTWRDEGWNIIKRTPHLTYQILTKRPERILDHLPTDWGDGYLNVWLGTSVENQEYADRRIPLLLEVPAVVRFLSCEPLLGPIDFRKVPGFNRVGLDLSNWWVIAGGESGYPGHFRPAELDWFRSLLDQCKTAGVPFFLK